MADTDVKQLLLQVDASVELLRRNLTAGERQVERFTSETQRRLDATDRRFERFGRPLSGISATITQTNRRIASIGNSVEAVERRVRSSMGGIRSALASSTAGIAAALSVNQIAQYADGYTRFTNQLKLAGLEGQRLGQTQEDLFGIAQKYGVQLESVGVLYGRVAQSANALGASQSDLLRFTNGVGAALKIQGGSAEAAQGALLQLSQLLGTGVVRAEEFNSVNEGARPILQAVANGIDRFKGSVAALRNEVIEGKVSSQEFFQGFLRGSAALEEQATRANLTIGASFTILNNALGKYIGETDAAVGATTRVSDAIIGISKNLDLLVPALAVIGVGIGVRALAAPFALATAEVGLFIKALDTERVVMLGSVTATAQKAAAASSAASAELAGIESTIVARRAEQAALAETIAAERALAAQRRASAALAAASNVSGAERTAAIRAQRIAENDAAFATQRLTVARQRLAIVDAELAAAETGLAGAQARSAAASTAATAAAAQATLAARAGATASKLFAGALTLIGGSVAGGAAVLGIGALVAAILYFRSETRNAQQEIQDFKDNGESLKGVLLETSRYGLAAGGAIGGVGTQAAGATPAIRAFAGAVGEAADKLFKLAQANKIAALTALQAEGAKQRVNAAALTARAAEVRGNQQGAQFSRAGDIRSQREKDEQDFARQRAIIANQRYQVTVQEFQRLKATPLTGFLKPSDTENGRDVEGDLARVTRDLTIARKRGITAQVASLEAQKFELTQYKGYRKSGLSPQAAQEAAGKDAAAFRDGTAGRASDKASARAKREGAAAARRQVAEVRDAAADARAFSAAERQANNDIAAARAELANSAEQRAEIERGRIENERQNRNDEIQQQAVQGRFGTGETAKARVLELQSLNDQRASLETQVVLQRERQRMDGEALELQIAGLANQRDTLQGQAELATTAAERRNIELRLIDLAQDEEEARLRAVLAFNSTATAAERQAAIVRLSSIEERYGNERRVATERNASPLEAYRRSTAMDAGQVKEAIEAIEVEGLRSLSNELENVVTGVNSVGDAFSNIAKQIIGDLARIAIQQAIVKPLAGSLFGGLGFSGGGRIPGFAEGGSPGGQISGPGTGTSDSILAVLGGGKGAIRVSTGEFIVNAAATRANLPLLHQINARKFATGGPVTPSATFAPKTPSLANMQRGGGATVHQSFDLRGAVMTEDLVRQMDARSQQAAAIGASGGRAAVGNDLRRAGRARLPGGLGG